MPQRENFDDFDEIGDAFWDLKDDLDDVEPHRGPKSPREPQRGPESRFQIPGGPFGGPHLGLSLVLLAFALAAPPGP